MSARLSIIYIYTLLLLQLCLSWVYSAQTNNPALVNNLRSCSVLKQNYSQYSGITALDSAALPPNFCASVYNSHTGSTRGLLYLANSNALLSVVGGRGIYWNYDANNNGYIDNHEDELRLIISQDDLNHGIAYSATNGKLYASSESTVYSWEFTDQIPPTVNNRRTIIEDIPSGGHSTRTLLMDDSTHFLYVSLGSEGNVDESTTRSLIRRFSVDPATIPSGVYSFSTGELFASGLRNEVGLTFDKYGSLWGVQNSADNLHRDDLGGDIHQDNPAEDLHHFDQGTGRYYGYPYCFTEYSLPSSQGGLGRGTKWAWFQGHATYTDEWCRDTDNVVPPNLALQAHSAPLSLKFYTLSNSSPRFGFPANYSNQLFIGYHGSWNRSPPTGYKVVTVPITDTGSSITVSSSSEALDFFRHNSNDDNWNFRPVDLAIGKQGEIYLSNDGSNSAKIIVIRYMDGDISTAPDVEPPTNNPPTTNNANTNYNSHTILRCLLFCFAWQFITIFIYSSW